VSVFDLKVDYKAKGFRTCFLYFAYPTFVYSEIDSSTFCLRLGGASSKNSTES